ncbi:MAG: YeeE/YedE thiosulfate transporter family protein [Thermogutta sp.]
MFPIHLSGTIDVVTTVLLGFAFGFVLEKAGFGDSRNLAAQFYLSDLRVLKVMFSAIVTAMLLIFAASALGLVDFEQIFVPPTYLGASLAGGAALGVGFIIGGYCPGTSLVSLATFKWDGLVFALGVACGMFAFGWMSPNLINFWTNVGAMDRVTIFEWLGVDAGVVVAAVLLMAIGAFFLAEIAEARIQWGKPPVAGRPNSPAFLRTAVACGLAAAGIALVRGQPDAERKIAWNATKLEEQVRSRSVLIDPAELLDLIHNNQVERLLLDVRDEGDYNVFHLKDAVRTTIAEIDQVWTKRIRPEQVVVVMSNDEARAVEAWKHLAIHRGINAYILAGGVNRWCEIYWAGNFEAPGLEFPAAGDDRFRFADAFAKPPQGPSPQLTPIRFAPAAGDRMEAARPGAEYLAKRKFQAKIRLLRAVKAPGGGCGG